MFIPATVEEVNITVVCPLESVIVDGLDKVPDVVVHETDVSAPTEFPLVSLTIAVRVTVVIPLAKIEGNELVTLDTVAFVLSTMKLTFVVEFPATDDAVIVA